MKKAGSTNFSAINQTLVEPHENVCVSTQKGRACSSQDWREDLTASMRANCIAPSDDVIQRCFDLYVDELHAPILELEDELVDLSAEVSDGFAALESLLPQEMRQALFRRAAELAYDGEENPEW